MARVVWQVQLVKEPIIKEPDTDSKMGLQVDWDFSFLGISEGRINVT